MKQALRRDRYSSVVLFSLALSLAATSGAFASESAMTSKAPTVEAAKSELGDAGDCSKEYQRPGLKMVPELAGFDPQGKPIYRESGEAK